MDSDTQYEYYDEYNYYCPVSQIVPCYIAGPPGPQGPPGFTPSLEPGVYSTHLDITDTDTKTVPMVYVGGPAQLSATTSGFLPVVAGRYMVVLSAFAQVTGKYTISMHLASSVDLNLFGMGQVVTQDGDVVTATGIVGLTTNNLYNVYLRLEPLLTEDVNFETQRITVTMSFILV